jgi:histidine triad (HIT) family protein
VRDPSCTFCRIVAGEIPADVVARRDGFLAFRDIAPKAPVHVLVVPKRHVTSVAAIDGMPPSERAAMLEFIAEVAREAGLEVSGYRVTANHGLDARQSVPHLHWHVLGGAMLSASM